MEKFGLIAGNGQFPFLVLREAHRQGHELVVAAIREEAFPELEQETRNFHWLSIADLSGLIRLFKKENVSKVMMAGQVKHKIIFSSIKPDWRLLKLLTSLKEKNTDALIGGVARVLSDEGMTLIDSTTFLRDMIPSPGVLTSRKPSRDEQADFAYGRKIAKAIAGMDLGQCVVIKECACVAIEAMEGTDAVIRRAAELSHGGRITVVKVCKPNQDMRFDVPVIGRSTVELMAQSNATALAVDADKTLLFEREELIALANEKRIAIEAFAP
ncbi:MAG: UDP-2,3-diacylglucosamine diphosphatase LpxI [Acidobacteriia bacterium]|nr:UDP-2,3-diacylglucosamine diphosphatase LpxI [Terriglobia bacterium]